jgi:hypothetical protein
LLKGHEGSPKRNHSCDFAADVTNATARLIADRHDEEAIEDEEIHPRVVAVSGSLENF